MCLFILSQKKKKSPQTQQKRILYICFTFIIFFFLGEKIESRGRRSMWLPYMSKTIVIPYLLPDKILYALYVRNSPIIIWIVWNENGILETPTHLVVSYQCNTQECLRWNNFKNYLKSIKCNIICLNVSLEL